MCGSYKLMSASLGIRVLPRHQEDRTPANTQLYSLYIRKFSEVFYKML
jgi:hypothetical protein